MEHLPTVNEIVEIILTRPHNDSPDCKSSQQAVRRGMKADGLE